MRLVLLSRREWQSNARATMRFDAPAGVRTVLAGVDGF